MVFAFSRSRKIPKMTPEGGSREITSTAARFGHYSHPVVSYCFRSGANDEAPDIYDVRKDCYICSALFVIYPQRD
jgi:hypothetical protein